MSWKGVAVHERIAYLVVFVICAIILSQIGVPPSQSGISFGVGYAERTRELTLFTTMTNDGSHSEQRQPNVGLAK